MAVGGYMVSESLAAPSLAEDHSLSRSLGEVLALQRGRLRPVSHGLCRLVEKGGVSLQQRNERLTVRAICLFGQLLSGNWMLQASLELGSARVVLPQLINRLPGAHGSLRHHGEPLLWSPYLALHYCKSTITC